MKIAVLGGGNGAHAMAADLSLAGHEVNMYDLPQFKEKFKATLRNRGIKISGMRARKGVARLNKVTTDIMEALKDVEFIMIVVPSFGQKTFAEICTPHLEDGQTIILWPGNMGSLEFAKIFKEKRIEKDILLAEASTLPYGCRLAGPARVDCPFLATKFYLASFPAKNTWKVVNDLKKIYPPKNINGVKFHEIIPGTNVVEVALSNPNPIVHPPATLLNAGRIEYSKGEFYLYREGITRSVRRVIKAVYKEFLAVGKALGVEPMQYDENVFRKTNPMGEIFPAPRISFFRLMLTVLKGIVGLDTGGVNIWRGTKGPHSMQDRYVTEDVPYCLVPVSILGDVLNVPTPIIDTQITLLSEINQTNYWSEGRTLEKLGISGLGKEELQKFLAEGQI